MALLKAGAAPRPAPSRMGDPVGTAGSWSLSHKMFPVPGGVQGQAGATWDSGRCPCLSLPDSEFRLSIQKSKELCFHLLLADWILPCAWINSMLLEPGAGSNTWFQTTAWICREKALPTQPVSQRCPGFGVFIFLLFFFFPPSLQTVQCLQLKWNWDLSKFVASETLKTSRKLLQKTPLDLPRSELLRSILD